MPEASKRMRKREKARMKEKEKQQQKVEKESKPTGDQKTVDGETQPGTDTKKHRKRLKGLYKRLGEQLEFYFSDANLRKDGFMMSLIKNDPWVPLNIFEKFNKIKNMMVELPDGTLEHHLVKALEVKKSSLLELSEDGTKVRRINNLQDKTDVEDCTIYVENISPDTSHEILKSRFQQFGPVAYVSIPKFRASQKAKGFAFIEFESKEGVLAVLKACGVNVDQMNLPDPSSLASIKTFNKEDECQNGGDEKEVTEKGTKRKLENEDDVFDTPKRLRIDENQRKAEMQESESTPKLTDTELLSMHGFRILTKTQWRRLRNQYLNQQRKNVSTAKAYMKKVKAGDGWVEKSSGLEQEGPQQEWAGKTDSEEWVGDAGVGETEDLVGRTGEDSAGKPRGEPVNSEAQEAGQQPGSGNTGKPLEFIPGLILRISVPDGIDDTKKLKRRVRQEEDVSYVDARICENQFFVRCRTEEQTDRLLGKQIEGWTLVKLKDEEERRYWEKIEQDMKDKKSGKVIVPKERKKKTILDKMEKYRNSHIHFGD